jgi:hypothetical protein
MLRDARHAIFHFGDYARMIDARPGRTPEVGEDHFSNFGVSPMINPVASLVYEVTREIY